MVGGSSPWLNMLTCMDAAVKIELHRLCMNE